jgi:hypothetical protein
VAAGYRYTPGTELSRRAEKIDGQKEATP